MDKSDPRLIKAAKDALKCIEEGGSEEEAEAILRKPIEEEMVAIEKIAEILGIDLED